MRRSLKEYCGIKGSHTSPFHPQGNGQVERFNRTLLSMLRTLTEEQKTDWKSSLAKVVHAYNCTCSEATGYSPFYLLFGRPPRLPIDLLFDVRRDSNKGSYQEYVENWRKRMAEAYVIASRSAAKTAARGKRQYDKKCYGAELQQGSRVLVRNVREKGGPGKIRSYWEDRVYVVVRRKGKDSPVFEVKPENGGGRTKVLHRNLLLPCDHLPIEQGPQNHQCKEVTKKRHRTKEIPPLTQTQEQTDSEWDSEEEFQRGYYSWPSTEQQATSVLNPAADVFHPQGTEERQLPMTPVEDQALHTEAEDMETLSMASDEEEPQSSTGKPADDTEQGNEDQHDIQDTRFYPQRERRQPKTLTYETLGQPSIVRRNLSAHKITMDCFWRPW